MPWWGINSQGNGKVKKSPSAVYLRYSLQEQIAELDILNVPRKIISWSF